VLIALQVSLEHQESGYGTRAIPLPAAIVEVAASEEDGTNDLQTDELRDLMAVTITHASRLTFDVTVSNTSAMSTFPLLVAPVVWAVHDETASVFELGMPASEGLEHLAEDGNPHAFSEELAARAGVADSGTEGTAPIDDGDSFALQITVDSDHPYLSLASMITPSNDTFWSLGATGIQLLDAEGMPRSNDDIANDVAQLLAAFDAGTEANQAAALGPDMAPYQEAPNTGAAEGAGVVRPVDRNHERHRVPCGGCAPVSLGRPSPVLDPDRTDPTRLAPALAGFRRAGDVGS
jgi:hypothetical protein